MEIGYKIKTVRLMLGHSQVDFSNLLDIPQSHLSAIESGKKDITLKIALKLKFDFDFSLDWLFDPNKDLSSINKEDLDKSKLFTNNETKGSINDYIEKAHLYSDILNSNQELKTIDMELYCFGQAIKDLEEFYIEHYKNKMEMFILNMNKNAKKDLKGFMEKNKDYYNNLVSLNKRYSPAISGINETLAGINYDQNID